MTTEERERTIAEIRELVSQLTREEKLAVLELIDEIERKRSK